MPIPVRPIQQPYQPGLFEGFVGVATHEPVARKPGFGEMTDIYPSHELSQEEKMYLMGVRNSDQDRMNAEQALALIEAHLDSGMEPIRVFKNLMNELHPDHTDDPTEQAIGGYVLAAWLHEENRFL